MEEKSKRLILNVTTGHKIQFYFANTLCCGVAIEHDFIKSPNPTSSLCELNWHNQHFLALKVLFKIVIEVYY